MVCRIDKADTDFFQESSCEESILQGLGDSNSYYQSELEQYDDQIGDKGS